MRILIALLIFGVSTSANATLIQIDLSGFVRESQFGEPGQSITNASLLLDTAGAVLSITPRRSGPRFEPCFKSLVSSRLSGQLLGISVDGAAVLEELSGISGSADLVAEFDGTCEPRQLFGSLDIKADGYRFFFPFLTAQQVVSLDDVLASTDPTATLLLKAVMTTNISVAASLLTAAGEELFIIRDFRSRDVTDVPEPPITVLLLLGLAGLVIGRRQRPLVRS